MAQNLTLSLRITGDASGLRAEIAGAKRDVDALGTAGSAGGQQAASGLGGAAAAATRLQQGAEAAARQVQGVGGAGAAAGQQASVGLTTAAAATVALRTGAETAGQALAAAARAADVPVGQLNLRLAAATAAGELFGAGLRVAGNLLQATLAGAIAGVASQLVQFAFQQRDAAAAADALAEAQNRLEATMRRATEFFETAAERARRLAGEQRAMIAVGIGSEMARVSRELDREQRALQLLERDRAARIEDSRNLPGFDPSRVLAEPIAQRRAEIQRLTAALAELDADRARALAAPSGAERDAEARASSGRAPAAPRSLADPLEDMQRRAEQLTQSLRTPIETYSDAVEEATRLNALFEASQGRIGISAETMSRALTRARQQYLAAQPPSDQAREAERMRRAFDELGRMGEAAFDRVGSAITQALAQGQLDFRRLNQVGLAVASELTQAFLKLAIINPLRNAVFGGSATTIGDLGGAFGSWLRGPPSTASVDASLATMVGVPFHTGGVAGREAGGVPRALPASLFATAPRFHAGRVAPDEVPAILRRDEGVFTPAQMARLGPAGGSSYTFAPTIHFSGSAGSADDRAALVAGLRAAWQADLRGAVPGIVEAAKGSLRGDVRRMGVDRALAGA